MALKAALYRGPSSRLETLIEKIQANNKEINSDACSIHTSSPSFSPSISEGATTPNSTLSQQRHHKYHNFSSGGGENDGDDGDGYIDINDVNGGDNNKKNLHYNHYPQQQTQQPPPPFKFFSLSDEEATERESIGVITNIEETERSYSLPPSFLSPTSPTIASGSASTGLINKRLNRRRERHLLFNNNNNHNYNYYHLRRPINHDLLMDDNDGVGVENVNVNNRKSQKSNKKLRNNKESSINNERNDEDNDYDDETRTTTTSEILKNDNADYVDGDDDNSDNSKNIKLKNISQKRKRTYNDNDDNIDIDEKNYSKNNNNDRIELEIRNNNYNKLNNNSKLLNNNNNSNMESINATVNNNNNNNNKGILLKDILKKNAKLADKVKNCNGGSNNGTTTTTDGSYPCQFCDKSFPRLGYLKKHEQSHAEHLPFKCEYCARLFKHKRSRDRHTKLHTGDRRYRCPHCEAAFSRSDHLKIHMKTHDNQKPFQCTICNRGYNTAAALTSHIQNHKKQAALMGTGLQPLNYSPRSTGSTSSSAGSLFGLRHPKSPLSMSGTDYCGSNTGSPIRTDSKQSSMMHHQNLACMYCTQNSFNDLEQLNHHIQITHKNLSGNGNGNESLSNDGIQNQKTTPTPSTPTLTPRATPTPTSITQSLTPIPSGMLSFPMSCDYCTMKFTNISIMFQHMKAAHIDQMKISNFQENFEGLPNSFGFPSNFGGASTSPMIPPPTIATDCFDDIKIKKESPSPNSNKQQSEGGDNGDNSAALEKDENLIQLRPTDLSQPKKHLNVTPTSSNNENNLANEKFFQRTFLCNQCNEALPDFHSFRNHLKLHITQKMGMICQHCGITLHDKNELDRHVMSHFLIATSEFICSKSCKKTFTKVDDLRTHLFEQHSQIVYKCTLCTEVFDTKIAIQVHLSCTHVNETKTYQCSACMKQFRNEEDFSIHVKSHLTPPNGCIQCMFCRTICTSQLEMHFHLAAHTQQFRCPSCPETFQVEFLLERHIQTHHTVRKDPMHHIQQQPQDLLNGPKHLMQEESEQYSATQQQRQSPSGYSSRGKSLFQIPNSIGIKPNNKFYSPLQVNINANSKTHLKYGGSGGLNQRYDAKKSLLNLMYNNYHHQQQQHQQDIEKLNNDTFNHGSNFLLSPTTYFDNNYDNMAAAAAAAAAVVTSKRNHIVATTATNIENPSKSSNSAQTQATATAERKQIVGFSCGMCERNDFRTESEVNTHRKIVHNLKTGVSLRCAYCSGNFKSRSELEHHMKACHNSMGKHKCLICDEIFPSPAILAEHKLQHSRVGRSGKCVHCSAPLNDIATFKLHLSKHITTTKDPIQCICCRQTLNSDFEVELHARYHTKTPNVPENGCVLCLEPLPSTAQTRLCEKCDLKHKYTANNSSVTAAVVTAATSNNASTGGIRFPTTKLQQPNYSEYLENKCHLCKIILPHQQRLQEHLVEHTFAGCEERGYSCYICSSVFTIPGGLLNHMNEHGQNARPYDCNICQDKFFFRAELDNHLFKHQLNDTTKTDFIDKTLQIQSIQQPIDMIKAKELKNYHHPSSSHHHSGNLVQNQVDPKNRDIKDLIKSDQKPLQHDNPKNSRLSSENHDYKLHDNNNDNIFKTEIKIENKSIDMESNNITNNNNENTADINNEEDEYVEIEKLAENTSTQEH